MKVITWEYYLLMEENPTPTQIAAKLLSFGSEGWELCSVIRGNRDPAVLMFILKRPLGFVNNANNRGLT